MVVKLKRILLVEDNPNDAELTMEALDFLFCRRKFASVDCEDLAVILLDLKLPKIDGLEVLRTIKSEPNLKMIPVVFLTSSREERDLVESYKLGVNAYVVKPVDFGEFMNAVEELGVFWAIINEPPPVSGKRGEQA